MTLEEASIRDLCRELEKRCDTFVVGMVRKLDQDRAIRLVEWNGSLTDAIGLAVVAQDKFTRLARAAESDRLDDEGQERKG